MGIAYDKPTVLQFQTNGSGAEGYLTVASLEQGVPFVIRRVFWTYFTPNNITRGRHAHLETEMVIIAVHGRIRLMTEILSGETFEFNLDKPTEGVYLPPLCWHVMEYSHDAVQMVLASTEYTPADYIRSYDTFRQLARQEERTYPGHTPP